VCVFLPEPPYRYRVSRPVALSPYEKRFSATGHYSYERARKQAVGCDQDRPRLRVTLRRWGATVVLELQGPLTIETSNQPLGDLTEWMGCRGRCQLQLDLNGVSRMDCSGIGQLVMLHEKVRRLGGGFALVNVGHRHKHLLRVAGLLPLIHVFDGPGTVLSRVDDYDVA
jgi:anti-sigma B factor antagonist